MSISVEISEGEAVFRHPPEYEFCFRQFDQLLDRLDSEEISDKEYLRRLGDLNRPFLRAASGVIECRTALGENAKAITLMEKILAWDPNDHQGWRWQIGSEYLRGGSPLRYRIHPAAANLA